MVNQTKSVHVTFTLRNDTCPSVDLNGVNISQFEDMRYLVYIQRDVLYGKSIFRQKDVHNSASFIGPHRGNLNCICITNFSCTK